MRVCYSVHTLVMDNCRTLEHACLMVVASCHAEKIFHLLVRGASVNEERFLHFGRIDCKRNVLDSICAKSSGVFVSVFGVYLT